MGYQGRASFDKTTQTLKLDTLASAFNGAQTVFSLTSGNRAIYPATTRNLLISINGVVQEPDAAFTVNGSSITFTSAPATNATFFGVLNGQPNDLVLTPSVQSITVNNTMVVNASGFYAGTNVVANTTTVFVGNSSVNTAITAGSIAVNGGAATLSQTFRGLTLRTHPDADVAASKVFLNHADEILLNDGTRAADWDDLTADITVSGAGGLDTGSEGASRWYEIHAIRKSSDGTKNLLLHRAKSYDLDQSQTTDDGGASSPALRYDANQERLGQSFVAGLTGYLHFVDVKLDKFGTPTGNMWATLEADSSGAPSGTALATSDKLDVSLVSTTDQLIRLIFRTPVSLTATTTYWLVLRGDYTVSAANGVAWLIKNSGNPYASGTAAFYNGATWSNQANKDFHFKTYITQNDAAVTMPSGYDQYAHIGWVYNNSGSNFNAFAAVDKRVRLSVPGTSGDLAAGTPVTLIDFSSVIPPVPVTLTVNLAPQGAAGMLIKVGPVPDGLSSSLNSSVSSLAFVSWATASDRSYGIGLVDFNTEAQAFYMFHNGASAARVYGVGFSW